MVQALGTGNGEIRWTTDLGDDQGFHHHPTLIDEGKVFLAGPECTVALDFSEGTELWRYDGPWPLALTPAGEVVATVGDVNAIESPAGAIVQNGRLITMSRSGLSGFDLADGTLLWAWSPTSPIVDLATVTSGFAAVPTADRSVVVVTLP